MSAFTGGGTETEVWSDTLQSGQPAMCLPGSPLHPAGKAAPASEVCPAPHHQLETFPAAVLYPLGGTAHPLIRAEDCERASDYLFNHHGLVLCGKEHRGAGRHRRRSSVPGKGQPRQGAAASCARSRPLPNPKQCLHLSKHPHSQRGRVRLTAALFANIQLAQHPSVFSRYIYIINNMSTRYYMFARVLSTAHCCVSRFSKLIFVCLRLVLDNHLRTKVLKMFPFWEWDP